MGVTMPGLTGESKYPMGAITGRFDKNQGPRQPVGVRKLPATGAGCLQRTGFDPDGAVKINSAEILLDLDHSGINGC